MYCNNSKKSNFNAKYWAVVSPKLSGPAGVPDCRKTTLYGLRTLNNCHNLRSGIDVMPTGTAMDYSHGIWYGKKCHQMYKNESWEQNLLAAHLVRGNVKNEFTKRRHNHITITLYEPSAQCGVTVTWHDKQHCWNSNAKWRLCYSVQYIQLEYNNPPRRWC
jgi:hypothetical protein